MNQLSELKIISGIKKLTQKDQARFLQDFIIGDEPIRRVRKHFSEAGISLDNVTIRHFFEAGVDLNYCYNGTKPLALAIREENIDAVKDLLFYGASIHTCDSIKYTALDEAIFYNFNDAIDLITSLAEKKDQSGETLLHIIARNKKIKTVKHLIESGIDPNIKNNQGKIAKDCTESVMIKILISQYQKQCQKVNANSKKERQEAAKRAIQKYRKEDLLRFAVKRAANRAPKSPGDIRLLHDYDDEFWTMPDNEFNGVLSEKQQEEHTAVLKKDEKGQYRLYNSNGICCDTQDKVWIFVVTSEGKLIINPPQGLHQELNHSGLAIGNSVKCAGEIKLHDGKITYLGNGSGHYKPEYWTLYQGFEETGYKKAFSDNIQISYYDSFSESFPTEEEYNKVIKLRKACREKHDKIIENANQPTRITINKQNGKESVSFVLDRRRALISAVDIYGISYNNGKICYCESDRKNSCKFIFDKNGEAIKAVFQSNDNGLSTITKNSEIMAIAEQIVKSVDFKMFKYDIERPSSTFENLQAQPNASFGIREMLN